MKTSLMVRAFPVLLVGMVTIAVSFSGCSSRLADQRVMELGPGEINSVVIDPVSHDQAVTVMAKSEGSPINVHIFRFADEETVERAITLGIDSDKIIARQLDSNEISLTATIPAGQEGAIRFATAKPASAKIKISISN